MTTSFRPPATFAGVSEDIHANEYGLRKIGEDIPLKAALELIPLVDQSLSETQREREREREKEQNRNETKT